MQTCFTLESTSSLYADDAFQSVTVVCYEGDPVEEDMQLAI